MSYFLGINYGSEGWALKPMLSAETALLAVKDGETYGNEWKILKEIEVTIAPEG